MKAFLICCLYIAQITFCAGQTHDPFWTDNKGVASKNVKIYIDKDLQSYGGLFPHILTWTGGYDKNYFANGQGKLVLGFAKKENGTRLMVTYDGTMVGGKKQGKGVYRVYLSTDTSFLGSMFPNYSYTGSFLQDEFHGYGNFHAQYIANEFVDYKLEHRIWRKDLFFYKCSGQFAKGKFVETNNKFEGKTHKMTWLGGSVLYKGTVLNGRPNGPGFASENTIEIRPIGYFYHSEEGNFINGRLSGYGKQTGENYIYEGNFVNGIREGKGKLTVYRPPFGIAELNQLRPIVSYIVECDFNNGQAEDFTSIYFQNSVAYKYTGPLKDGLIEGTGEIEYLDGTRFRGQFKGGMREGEGTVTFANGDRFSGVYQKDKPVKGIYYYSDGTIYEGGIMSTEETDYIKGKKTNNYKRHGSGTITEKGGRKYKVNCNNDNCTETF